VEERQRLENFLSELFSLFLSAGISREPLDASLNRRALSIDSLTAFEKDKTTLKIILDLSTTNL